MGQLNEDKLIRRIKQLETTLRSLTRDHRFLFQFVSENHPSLIVEKTEEDVEPDVPPYTKA